MIDLLLRGKLERFALKHKLVLQERGEVGFGRPCVGFCHGDQYVNYNPHKSDGDYKQIEKLYDNRHHQLTPEDAYHKHTCMAVLVHNENYDEALRQLGDWVEKLERIGVEVIEFKTGAKGVQAIMTGLFGRALKLR